MFKINLEEFFHEIEGHAIIKPKSPFVNKLSDIELNGDIYVYLPGKGIDKIKNLNEVMIDEYFLDNEVRFLNIPLVDFTTEADFLNGLRYTDDDVEEVINKMDRELNWINVLLPKSIDYKIDSKVIEEGEEILENFTFEDLVEIGHRESCKTRFDYKAYSLFEGRKNEIYLPFHNDIFNLYFYKKDPLGLYIRNVWIKDFHFSIPINASIFEITKMVVNIKSRDFVPDISRNNLDVTSRNIINTLIGKVIHIGALGLLNLSPDEKITLQNFIDVFYGDVFKYEK